MSLTLSDCCSVCASCFVSEDKKFVSLCSVIGIALFIIGAVGIAGHLSNFQLGGCAIGLAIPLALSSLLGGHTSNKGHKSRLIEIAFDIISALALIILSTLAFNGTISTTTLGWCVVGPTLAILSLKFLNDHLAVKI